MIEGLSARIRVLFLTFTSFAGFEFSFVRLLSHLLLDSNSHLYVFERERERGREKQKERNREKVADSKDRERHSAGERERVAERMNPKG